MTRAVTLTFHGEYKGHGHPHESPSVMTTPLLILAVPSALAGFLNVPGLSLGGLRNFTDWLGARVVSLGDHHPEAIEWNIALVGGAAGALGIALGWLIFNRDADTQAERDRVEIPLLYPLLRRKFFMDDLALGVVGFVKGPLAKVCRLVQHLCARQHRQRCRRRSQNGWPLRVQRHRPTWRRRCVQRSFGRGGLRRVIAAQTPDRKSAAVRDRRCHGGPGARGRRGGFPMNMRDGENDGAGSIAAGA